MLVGYARVSTQDQNLELQHDALKQAGCSKIFEDKMSGAKTDRPALQKALARMKSGDTLVIWKLSRLGRSVRQLIETGELLASKGIGLRSLQEHLDTSTAAGKLFFHIIAAFAQFERDNTLENTHAGLAAARARGRIGGRKRIIDGEFYGRAAALRATHPEMRIDALCQALAISRATYYRAMAAASSDAI